MVNFTFQLVEGYDSNDGVIGTINFTVDGVTLYGNDGRSNFLPMDFIKSISSPHIKKHVSGMDKVFHTVFGGVFMGLPGLILGSSGEGPATRKYAYFDIYFINGESLTCKGKPYEYKSIRNMFQIHKGIIPST